MIRKCLNQLCGRGFSPRSKRHVYCVTECSQKAWRVNNDRYNADYVGSQRVKLQDPDKLISRRLNHFEIYGRAIDQCISDKKGSIKWR